MPQGQQCVLEAVFELTGYSQYRVVDFREDKDHPFRSIMVSELKVSCPGCGEPKPMGPLPLFGSVSERTGEYSFTEAARVVLGWYSRYVRAGGNFDPIIPFCPHCGVMFAITESVILELQERARAEVPMLLEDLLVRAR